ncbi:4-(cytidine 5'-diphospho)-2-C-methyl-D-erythritol kinase [Comamonadaceae bacterium OH3737_COT-264]|nr:4-(cytidine 5'-diphospho)-2-C-methyl-D-erythritol kinase [Comamonadaceae bacterium OH3737_COT-264]
MVIEDILAPAKINLFLHIVGTRPDGYHLLQSAFVMIDWCDQLQLQWREAPAITREDLTHPLPADDLVLRAARALQQAAGVKQGAHIRIAKHIPAQAGLGGGSSDAASTLLALNRLWRLHWPVERLQALGVQLGADVPFFLGGRNAWVEGIGEQITPLPDCPALGQARLLVVKPQQGVATAPIFAHPLLKRDSPPVRMRDFAASPFDFGRNDMQPVAQTLCPEIKNTIDLLKSKGFQARMTGSGSAVFAVVPDSEMELQAAVDLMRWFEDQGCYQARVCKILDSHPGNSLKG